MKRSLALSLPARHAASFAADPPSVPKDAADAITAPDLLKHIKVLASDEFEGRAPGSKGEELSVKYISEQFKALGLKPGNPNGTYTQEVPLAGITTVPTASFTVGDKKDGSFPMITSPHPRGCNRK